MTNNFTPYIVITSILFVSLVPHIVRISMRKQITLGNAGKCGLLASIACIASSAICGLYAGIIATIILGI